MAGCCRGYREFVLPRCDFSLSLFCKCFREYVLDGESHSDLAPPRNAKSTKSRIATNNPNFRHQHHLRIKYNLIAAAGLNCKLKHKVKLREHPPAQKPFTQGPCQAPRTWHPLHRHHPQQLMRNAALPSQLSGVCTQEPSCMGFAQPLGSD